MTKLLLTALTVFSVTAACKERDPEAAGLLSDGTPAAAASEPGPADLPAGGAFTITCRPQDPELARDVFVLGVRGAVKADDEAQPVAVTVERRRANAAQQTDKLADGEPGRGAVRPKGAVFVGFVSGVLTAEYAGVAGNNTHTGLLTLAADPAVNGMPVGCTVTVR